MSAVDAPTRAGGSPAAARAFAFRLLSLLQSSSEPPNTRLSAAAYLASFIARASYVCDDLVLSTVSELTSWCLQSLSSSKTSNTPSQITSGSAFKSPKSSKKPKSGKSGVGGHQGVGGPDVAVVSSTGSILRSTLSSPSLHSLLPIPPQTPGINRTPSSSLLPRTPSSSLLPRTPSSSLLPRTPLPRSATVASVSTPLRLLATPVPAGPVPRSVLQGTCQAVLYILCFRLKDISANASSMQWLASIPLEALLRSDMRPLECTLESIAAEFTRQVAHLRLFDVDAILCSDSSKESPLSPEPRVQLRYGSDQPHSPCAVASEVGFRLGSQQQQQEDQQQVAMQRLDMFFPFDPYLLRTSLRFIRPIFNSWKQPFSSHEEGDEAEGDDQAGGEAQAMDERESDAGEDGDDSEGEEWSSEDEMEMERRGWREQKSAPGHDGKGLQWEPSDKSLFKMNGIHSEMSPVDFSPRSLECDPMMVSCTPPAHLPARLPSTLVKRL